MRVENKVLNYQGLKIYQDTEMFSYSLDSILLARFYKPRKSDLRIADFGTNNGIIPLIVARYCNPKTKIFGVEISTEACEVAQANIALNGLAKQVFVFNQNIKTYVQDKNNYFDVVYVNPPFFKMGQDSKTNTKKEKLTPARHETEITLAEIIYSAKVALKNGGRLVMVHLVERLDEIIYTLMNNNFKVNKIRCVYSKASQSAKKVLIEAVNDGNFGLQFLEPLVVHNEDGSYTKEVEAMFGD